MCWLSADVPCKPPAALHPERFVLAAPRNPPRFPEAVWINFTRHFHSSGETSQSYAFVAEPQTNGVAERFNRTLKEQIIHGRIYRNIAELRDAVRDFVELYNAQWIVEKNGYLSPAQARQAWHAAISIRPAA